MASPEVQITKPPGFVPPPVLSVDKARKIGVAKTPPPIPANQLAARAAQATTQATPQPPDDINVTEAKAEYAIALNNLNAARRAEEKAEIGLHAAQSLPDNHPLKKEYLNLAQARLDLAQAHTKTTIAEVYVSAEKLYSSIVFRLDIRERKAVNERVFRNQPRNYTEVDMLGTELTKKEAAQKLNEAQAKLEAAETEELETQEKYAKAGTTLQRAALQYAGSTDETQVTEAGTALTEAKKNLQTADKKRREKIEEVSQGRRYLANSEIKLQSPSSNNLEEEEDRVSTAAINRRNLREETEELGKAQTEFKQAQKEETKAQARYKLDLSRLQILVNNKLRTQGYARITLPQDTIFVTKPQLLVGVNAHLSATILGTTGCRSEQMSAFIGNKLVGFEKLIIQIHEWTHVIDQLSQEEQIRKLKYCKNKADETQYYIQPFPNFNTNKVRGITEVAAYYVGILFYNSPEGQTYIKSLPSAEQKTAEENNQNNVYQVNRYLSLLKDTMQAEIDGYTERIAILERYTETDEFNNKKGEQDKVRLAITFAKERRVAISIHLALINKPKLEDAVAGVDVIRKELGLKPMEYFLTRGFLEQVRSLQRSQGFKDEELLSDAMFPKK